MDICFFDFYYLAETHLRNAEESLSQKQQQEAKDKLSFCMRTLFQIAEMLSIFNLYCTKLNLIRDGKLGEHENPTAEQLADNFIKYGGVDSFAEKWPLIEQEVYSDLNQWGACRRFSLQRPNVYQLAINYLLEGGLDRFWTKHPEFLRAAGPVAAKAIRAA